MSYDLCLAALLLPTPWHCPSPLSSPAFLSNLGSGHYFLREAFSQSQARPGSLVTQFKRTMFLFFMVLTKV